MRRSLKSIIFTIIITTIVSCDNKSQPTNAVVATNQEQIYEWKLIMSWPKNTPGLGTGRNICRYRRENE